MVAAARFAVGLSHAGRRAVCGAAVWTAALLVAAPACLAEPPARQDGLFISVRNPIDSDVVNAIKAKTRRAMQRKERPIHLIVYDFNPGQGDNPRPSATKELGSCQEFADFLMDPELQGVTTVAFVHGDVSNHTVLPVLACREIVMASEARLGDITRGISPLTQSKIQTYAEAAKAQGRCPAIVLKMLDPSMEVLEGTWRGRGGKWWVDKRRKAEAERDGFIAANNEPVLPAGNVGFYSASEAQRFGLCSLVKDTRQDVAEAYFLTAASLREDPLEGRDPVAYRITLAEPLTRAVGERLQRQIRQAIGKRANFLIFQLDSSGGDSQIAIDLAADIRQLKDDKGELPVMTLAYIPRDASSVSTILALGCSEIAMGPNAKFGDFDSVVHERRGGGNQNAAKGEADPEGYKMVMRSLTSLAKDQGYEPLLVQGMLDRKLTVYQVRSQKDPPEYKLITEEEWEADQADGGPKHWNKESKTLIKKGGADGQFLKLDAPTARKFGFVREVVDNYPELCKAYALKEREVRDMGYDYLYRLAEFLAHPAVSVFLIMIGIACLVLELKVPGVGLPGVIAAVCFVLYFWAQSQLAGQIVTLAILLFILGLILIGLEIFVLPGSAILGISGVVLVILSLALATLEKKPETTQEWLSFGKTLGGIGISLAGAILLVSLVAWYLPSIPWASRLILKPPTEGEATVDEFTDTLAAGQQADLAALLGAIGVAATTLRPAGLAQFGEDYIDVVTDGSFVAAGSRIQVIEIEGNRIVVKEV
ncbi:MAG TPA: NfeD family protein [Gemmataceae bacterium]|nr:NfeD family protein [Gemmataceae bacterium]